MGQITATRNLVAIKVVRHAGQQDGLIQSRFSYNTAVFGLPHRSCYKGFLLYIVDINLVVDLFADYCITEQLTADLNVFLKLLTHLPPGPPFTNMV